MVKMWY